MYNGMTIYIKPCPQAIVLDNEAENPPPPPNAHGRTSCRKQIDVEQDNRRPKSNLFNIREQQRQGISNVITGHCEPVTLTPKF